MQISHIALIFTGVIFDVLCKGALFIAICGVNLDWRSGWGSCTQRRSLSCDCSCDLSHDFSSPWASLGALIELLWIVASSTVDPRLYKKLYEAAALWTLTQSPCLALRRDLKLSCETHVVLERSWRTVLPSLLTCRSFAKKFRHCWIAQGGTWWRDVRAGLSAKFYGRFEHGSLILQHCPAASG